MIIFRILYKILAVILSNDKLLIASCMLIIGIRWFLFGGIFAAIFVTVLMFFFFGFIFVLADSFGEKHADEMQEYKEETYITHDEKTVENIHSKIPTTVISRRDKKNTEHIIITKHRRLPKKITYE